MSAPAPRRRRSDAEIEVSVLRGERSEGRWHRNNGYPVESCPYREGHGGKLRRAWLAGWNDPAWLAGWNDPERKLEAV